MTQKATMRRNETMKRTLLLARRRVRTGLAARGWTAQRAPQDEAAERERKERERKGEREGAEGRGKERESQERVRKKSERK
eukprot:1882427-Rhodomonas_salina.1